MDLVNETLTIMEEWKVSQGMSNRSVVQAIQDLDRAPSRGFYFLGEGPDGTIEESYVPFPDLASLIARRAGALQAAGIRKGDRLAIILPDTREFITSFLGAILAGIIPVPIYPPTGVVQLDRYASTVGSIVAKSRACAVIATTEVEPALRAVQATHSEPLVLTTPEQLDRETAPLRAARISADDVAFLQFTSGSTSQPKGVAVTHRNIGANTSAIHAAFALTPDDVPVSWLPLFHDMGLIGFLLTALYATVSTRFMPTQMFLRRPGSWLRTISRHRGTISVAPNFAFALVTRRMKDDEIAKLDLSSWRIAGCGAEPIRAADLERFAERLAPAGFRREAFLPMYGLAEGTLAVTIPQLGSGLRCRTVDALKLRAERTAVDCDTSDSVRIVNCGPALSVNDVAIFALDDERSERPLTDGRVGEIRIRGPNVMTGYWNDAAASKAAFAGDYLRTGDLGFLRDGELYVCGRIKEMIIVNGRNYFPDDIERAALAVAGVRAAMAFQTRDAWGASGGGTKLVLAVEAPVPERIDTALLHRAINTEVGVSLDDIVLLAPGQLPKTSSGKPRRAEACRWYEAGTLRRQPRERRTAATTDNIQLA
ncbi:MAG: fatty acyl-AMP ligase [Sulfurifustis sp.]